ncbi:hypothetical protein HKD37_18G050947 [Glycine soja]
MYPPLEQIHKRCTLSCSQSTTQVDVPSTCTTKDVPSNVLRQRSQAVKPLILCEWGYKRILKREWKESKKFSDCVVLNSLTREKGDTKEFRRLVLRSFGKRRRETQKEFRRLVLGEFFLWMYHPLELIHKRCTLSCSQSTTQVDVPSTCTTKDVPSNVLRQRSQAVKPLILCEWGYNRILRREWEESKEFSDCVVLNSLTREKGDTKEFRRLVLRSFGKGRRETQKEFRRQTQVDVPSTCTTKDVPSNVLRQRSQAVKPLILCEWGYKRILRREWEESKEFSDCVVLNSLTREKGDKKNSGRRRETQKEFRQLALGEFFLAKGEENEKMNSTSFQGLENQKTSESFWYKEEEEVQRDSRLVKD